MPDYWYPLAVPTLGDDEIAAATAVLRSGKTTMGEKVEEFEAAFAARVGATHAVMVNSGSSADLLIALSCARPGIVVVPAVTWPTHVWAWGLVGSRVRLVDVGDINTTAEILAKAIDDQVVGVSIPHLMGVPCDMGPIVQVCEGLPITEDCCEALGATYNGSPVGRFGQAAAWSFFFSHHMTTMEGGMVTTDSDEIAERCRVTRSHGWARPMADPPEGDPRYTFVDFGFNLRPTEVAAAIGLVQLARLDTMNDVRRRNMDTIAKMVADSGAVRLPTVPAGAEPSWFGVPLLLDPAVDRDRFAGCLEDAGIETRPILAGNLTRQPVWRGPRPPLPGADLLHDHGLYVGLHPFDNGDAERVGAQIVRCLP